jgi:hypothetical protein
MAMAAPVASAQPNGKNTLTFNPVRCESLTGGGTLVTSFTVPGGNNGQGTSFSAAHTPIGNFHPSSLAITFDTQSFGPSAKGNVGAATYECRGATVITDPTGQAHTISFDALGSFS